MCTAVRRSSPAMSAPCIQQDRAQGTARSSDTLPFHCRHPKPGQLLSACRSVSIPRGLWADGDFYHH
ncbi:hypothetical protein SKAU_G00005110 [Synaphobranchus kaupii]|uniref:Uncharacterized protein n=1 Tax=Synaphobranchus kaupii TaxID=118154 RepID=A0A9Q1G9T7_SYNKA|nr:hypothetical protein SKAU_G00005110 [Synaphobranchus kaupii]